MRIRREATTRRPASSSILVTAPVRLRRVASGLMIEKVRSVAMAALMLRNVDGFARLSRHRGAARQAGVGPLGPLHPFALLALLPVARLDVRLRLETAPDVARLIEPASIEEIEAAIEAESLLSPAAVGKRDIGGAVAGGRLGGKQDRLCLRPCGAVRKEAVF